MTCVFQLFLEFDEMLMAPFPVIPGVGCLQVFFNGVERFLDLTDKCGLRVLTNKSNASLVVTMLSEKHDACYDIFGGEFVFFVTFCAAHFVEIAYQFERFDVSRADDWRGSVVVAVEAGFVDHVVVVLIGEQR